jgi:hypothetical protein
MLAASLIHKSINSVVAASIIQIITHSLHLLCLNKKTSDPNQHFQYSTKNTWTLCVRKTKCFKQENRLARAKTNTQSEISGESKKANPILNSQGTRTHTLARSNRRDSRPCMKLLFEPFLCIMGTWAYIYRGRRQWCPWQASWCCFFFAFSLLF